jgi:acetoacetate decarboxylase
MEALGRKPRIKGRKAVKSRYIKSEEEIRELLAMYKDLKFMNLDAVNCFYETKPEAIAAILPPPLEPVDSSVVMVQFASTARSNPESPYNCTGAWIPCKYKDVVGNYCVHWVFDSDFAIIIGRELMGEPKKYAKTTLSRRGNRIEGHTVRFGKEYVTMAGELEGPEDIDKMPKDSIAFYFKFLPACNDSGLEFDPILVKQTMRFDYKFAERGQGEIKYALSDHDFLYELEVIKPLGLFYSSFDVHVSSERLATVPAEEFLPYAFGKMDDYRLLIR